MPTVHEYTRELHMEAPATRRTLERVPEDKLDWKPHEKSLSMGQLAMHVAKIPGVLSEIALQPSFQVGTVIPRPTPASIAELLSTFEESIAKAEAVFSEMDDPSLTTPWKMFNGNLEVASMPRSDFLRQILFNHWYHHRGQLTVYLRETDVAVPAIYGASADEVPAF